MAKIIIVEDDMKVANIYKNRLTQEGHDVKICADVDAVKTITADEPNLVLLDILMPQISGLTILREIKTQSQLESIPVLVLTNVEGTNEVEQAISLGASGYLVKADTSLDMLVQKVKEVTASGAISTGVKG